jgi:Flp pilus assembly protein TadG
MMIRLRNRLIRKAKTVAKDEDGGAAVEFAIVAFPFFGLVIAVMEIGIFFFASRFLEDGVFNASRLALTGRLGTASSCADFSTAIRNNIGTWFDSSKVNISVSVLTSFSDAGTALDMSAAGCSMGTTGQTLLIQATYPYPFVGYRFSLRDDNRIGADWVLSAATALRVE